MRTPVELLRVSVAVTVALVAVLVGASCGIVGGGDDGGVDFTHAGTVHAPDFPEGLDWLNVDDPLSLRDLRGKIVLLDFWTQGCINCLHVIPDLHRLEQEYADSLVVIGVHSAKFDSEGRTESIRQSVLRYGIEHPVVNDNGFAVWSAYAVRAWPTTVLIDPNGRIVDQKAGEGVYAAHQPTIETMVAEYGAAGVLDTRPLEVVLESERAAPSVLSFPGKVLADEAGGRLFIADSNHHRILIADLAGRLTGAIGGRGGAGATDGPFAEATFRRPQGMALSPDGRTLYVADLGNHLIRAADLVDQRVTTVAGTGAQGFEHPVDGAPARRTPLNSPWDVLTDGDRVHIAMAGQHQLWTLDVGEGEVRVLAGTRREELRDGDPLEAGLNQPSGLATDGRWLYFADSEASAIRRLPLDGDGEVETLVGTGLFDFGDEDGVGEDVLLQHPVGVTWDPVGQRLLVADTYNHKVKALDVGERRVETWLGTGLLGWADGAGRAAQLAEPSGLSVAGRRVYVADTNNHVIRVADLGTGDVETLTLTALEVARAAMPVDLAGDQVVAEPVTVAPGAGSLELTVSTPDGYVFNELGPFEVRWTTSDPAVASFEGEPAWRQVLPEFPRSFPLALAPGAARLTGEATVYYCRKGEEEFCLIRQLTFVVEVTVDPAAGGSQVVPVRHALPPLPTEGTTI